MDADVIVVGAGPSGLTVANELRLHGCDVLVLERREQGVQSRAGTILPRVLELLDYRGHAQKFIDRARRINDHPLIPFHIWAGLQPIHWHLTGSPFGYRLVLPQNDTEELLLEIAEDAGVRFRRGETVVGLTQDENAVMLTTASPADERRSYRARYVVGADGGRSAVRREAGIDFVGHDGTFTGIIADVPVNMHWPDGRAMANNRHGWAASFPFGEGGDITRFNLVHAERRRVDRREPVTAAEVRACVQEIFERDIDFDELVWASRFDDTMRVADRLREGRVFLVGESARVHYPASGVGMNFCIQDGFNLGWKLGQVLRGIAGDTLLDTYETERRPVIDGLLESVRAQCAIQFDFTDEGLALKRMLGRDLLPLPDLNRAIGLQLNGLTEAYPTAVASHSLAGRPFPEAAVQTRDGLQRVAALLERGEFVLLDLTGHDLFPPDLPGVRGVSGALSAPSPQLAALRAVLLRPDGYVHWASSDRVPDTAAAVDALQQLTATERTTASAER